MEFYVSCLNSVVKFKGNEILISSITEEWFKKYELFFLDQGNSQATLSMRMRGIRTMMNIAKQKQLIKTAKYPFGK